MASKLGERIRSARERLGMTQAELGEAVGAARETVGNWELGTTSPRNKLGKLREVLGENLDGSVGAPDQDGGVLLSLPPDAFAGLSLSDREEAISAAKAALLERAREIRRRLDDR